MVKRIKMLSEIQIYLCLQYFSSAILSMTTFKYTKTGYIGLYLIYPVRYIVSPLYILPFPNYGITNTVFIIFLVWYFFLLTAFLWKVFLSFALSSFLSFPRYPFLFGYSCRYSPFPLSVRFLYCH